MTAEVCSPAKPRLAILISGRGSNMEALARAAAEPGFPGTVALVLSSNPAAEGLATAALLGLETCALPHRAYPDRAAFDAALTRTLERHAIDAIALAGFMRILTPGFIRRWLNRIVNIHPSLLPRHQGLDTHARALAAGDTEAGCTVHIVTEQLDDGPILAQARVPVLADDTAETLGRRVLAAEHRLYPAAVAEFLSKLPRVQEQHPS